MCAYCTQLIFILTKRNFWTKTEEQQDCNEAEDSEGDEMVDIERIEDKEEDPATTAQAKV